MRERERETEQNVDREEKNINRKFNLFFCLFAVFGEHVWLTIIALFSHKQHKHFCDETLTRAKKKNCARARTHKMLSFYKSKTMQTNELNESIK